MVMTVGVPGLFYMQQIFWAFVGTAIAVGTLLNVFNIFLYRQRISASKKTATAAKPKSLIFKFQATLTAILREYSYYSPPLYFGKWHFYLPPVGPTTIMVGYVVLIVVCSLYRLNPKDFLQWEDIGYRAGFIAVCQLPLIVLLAGKRNIIGFLTGVGYERLNWLHRWTARALLLTVLIHMGFWMTEWAKFDYIMVKIKTDSLTQRGIAAGSVLAWLVVSSAAPIRGLSYEIFVVQHVISWLGFLVAVYLHVPAENHIWIWLPLGFWVFDRVARAVYLFYANLALFHKNTSGFLSCRATFEPLDEGHTRITIANPPVTWKAGQHMFLACHVIAPLSSHPFTIASLPEDGKMEFVVRAKKGATKRFFKYAEKVYPSLPISTKAKVGRSVLIDGPYARIRPLRQFDSLVFIAGSTGATFTVPLMRDIIQQWMGTSAHSPLDAPPGAVTRKIRFVWVVKKTSSIHWFASHLDKAIQDVETLRNQGHDVALDISVYVTCDETLTSGESTIPGGGQVAQDITSSSSSLNLNEKEMTTEEIVSRTSTGQNCCCTRDVDEDAVTAPCTWSTHTNNPSPPSCQTPSPIFERISILTGRPRIRKLIRKTAEVALGEMAVVVCGPPGMVQGTRNAAVAVSDERAVHKGTGAQGIYVHAECFGYA